MKAQMLVANSCLLFHHWKEILNTGFTIYSECCDCKSRKLRQRDSGGYQPVNFDWLCGIDSNDELINGGIK